MNYLLPLVLVLHVLVGLGVIGLVLLQHGKGADMGSGFGGGASTSLFGATGSANFLSRMTAVLATVFFATSLGLAYLATHRVTAPGGGVMDAVKGPPATSPQEPSTPAAVPVPATPAPDASKGKEVPN